MQRFRAYECSFSPPVPVTVCRRAQYAKQINSFDIVVVLHVFNFNPSQSFCQISYMPNKPTRLLYMHTCVRVTWPTVLCIKVHLYTRTCVCIYIYIYIIIINTYDDDDGGTREVVAKTCILFYSARIDLQR